MAVLYMDSCGDHLLAADQGQKYSATSATTPTRTTGRNGSGWAITNGRWLQRLVTPVTDGPASAGVNTTLTTGFAIKRDGGYPSSAAQGEIYSLYLGATKQLGISIDNAGVITAWRNGASAGTLIATASAAVDIQGFQYLEIQAKVHSTTGTVRVRIDGNDLINASSLNTGTNGGCDTVQWGYDLGAGSLNIVIDDLYLCDVAATDQYGTTTTAGVLATNGGFLGDVVCGVIDPRAAGNYTQFTPSAGSNWQNVDDATPDGDSTYNTDTVNAHRDSFFFTTLSGVTGIKGLQISNSCKSTVSTRYLTSFGRVGGTDYDGTKQTIGTGAYAIRRMLYDTNPSDATGATAWTTASVNAAEFGYKMTTS